MAVATLQEKGPANFLSRYQNPLLEIGLLLFILIMGIAHAFLVGAHLLDDAFITFRYSANFGDHLGLVFNYGEKVEGFTNLLWTLLLVPAYKLNLDLPMVSWFLGLFFMLVTVLFTVALAKNQTSSRSIAFSSGLTLVLSMNFVGSSIQGLETSMYAAMLVLSLFGLFTGYKYSPWIMVFALCGLSVTRAEGMFLAPVILLLFLFKHRKNLLIGRRPHLNLLFAISVLAFIGLVELGRILYYGELLPMSVIAKQDRVSLPFSKLVEGWSAGLAYIVQSLGWQTLVLLLLTGVPVIIFLRRERAFFYITSLALIGFCLVVTINNRGDWMPNARLLTPYFPVLVVFFLTGLHDLAISLFSPHKRLALYLPLCWVVLFTIVQPASSTAYMQSNIFDKYAFSRADDWVGLVFKETYRQGDFFSSGLLGRMSYYSRPVNMFDLSGLTEPRLAKLPREGSIYGKSDASLVAELRPTVISHNDWKLLNDIISKSKDSYVGVMSQKLFDNRVFIFIRADAADRIGKPLADSFGGEVLDAQTVLNKLKELYPKGA